jgi:hypothetical protein
VVAGDQNQTYLNEVEVKSVAVCPAKMLNMLDLQVVKLVEEMELT